MSRKVNKMITIKRKDFDELINSIKKRETAGFKFFDGLAVAIADETEIWFETSGREISEEHMELAVSVLQNLDECVRKAERWLSKVIRKDEWYPYAFDDGFEICSIYFGSYGYGDYPSITDGFTLTFSTVNYFPCNFTVKYFRHMQPYAIEEWIY